MMRTVEFSFSSIVGQSRMAFTCFARMANEKVLWERYSIWYTPDPCHFMSSLGGFRWGEVGPENFVSRRESLLPEIFEHHTLIQAPRFGIAFWFIWRLGSLCHIESSSQMQRFSFCRRNATFT